MDLYEPTTIQLDEISKELLHDAHTLAQVVNESRPLQTDVLENVQKELLGERVYNSNAIEGNTLTLRETRSILAAGTCGDVGRKREASEAINLGQAIGVVQEFVSDQKRWHDLPTFLSIHKILLTDVNDAIAGKIRHERVIITGAQHQPPRHEKLDELLTQLFATLDESSAEPLTLATWVHWAISRIHPFFDGNGRMARLWQDLILFGNKFSAAIIRQQDRDEYYSALGSADEGEFNPLFQLVARSLCNTLQVYVNAQREVDELKGWAAKVVGETNARIDEERKLEYIRWSRQMEQIRDSFDRCASQITNASNGSVEVQLSPFDILDQSTWETIRAGGKASKIWFFWLNFRSSERRIQYCFYFGQHWSSDVDRKLPSIQPNTCLLVSEQVEREKAKNISEIEGSPITLREVLIVQGQLARKRFDVASNKAVYDEPIESLSIARDFIQEVLLSRIG